MKKSKETVQSELDDLLIVFGDLEDQVAKQKVRVEACQSDGYKANDLSSTQSRLRELGEPVSDAEEDSDDEDDVD